MGRLIEPGIRVVLGTARPVPQRKVAHPPALALGPARRLADAWHPWDLLRHTGSKRMSVRTTPGLCANSSADIRWSWPEQL